MFVCKKSKVPTRKNKNEAPKANLVYLNGVIDKHNHVGLRIDGIRPGDYYVIYKHDYPGGYPYQKLNLILNGQ
jgi:hypothetical protein